MEQTLKKQQIFFKENGTKSYEFRIKQLTKLENYIRINEDQIADALAQDLSRDQAESYMLEIHTCLDEINYYKKHLKSMMKTKRVKTNLSTFSSRSYISQQPKGVTLIISPWNYPLYLTIIPLINNIGAGNTTILKLSERLTRVNALLEQGLNTLFAEEYIHVLPTDQKNYEAINLDVDHIFFTGSTEVGKLVMKAASQKLIPVTLELGGKSPVIVSKNANIERVVSELIWGKLLNSGQTCIAPDHVYIHESLFDNVLEELKVQIKNYQPDNRGYIDKAHSDKIKSLLEGNEVIFEHKFNEESLYVTNGQVGKLAEEEIFGMILPFIKFRDYSEVLPKIYYPLATYIFSTDKQEQSFLTDNILCHGFTINGTITHIANHNLPFGGVKSSGLGQYCGKAGFKELTYTRALLHKGWFRPWFINPPYDYEHIKKMLKLVRLGK